MHPKIGALAPSSFNRLVPSSWAGLWAAVDSPPEIDTKLYDVLGIGKEASVADIKKVPKGGPGS